MEIYGTLKHITRIKTFILSSIHLKNFCGYSEYSEIQKKKKKMTFRISSSSLESQHNNPGTKSCAEHCAWLAGQIAPSRLLVLKRDTNKPLSP